MAAFAAVGAGVVTGEDGTDPLRTSGPRPRRTFATPPYHAPVADTPVSLSRSGPPETILDPEPEDARRALAEALDGPADGRRGAIAGVVAAWPAFLDGWARLGEHARDDVEAYACFRVAYHRGLDRLRASGWRGSGYVRAAHETNRGFLRGLAGLGRSAARLGEDAEAERCAELLRQLDPGLDPADPGPGLGSADLDPGLDPAGPGLGSADLGPEPGLGSATVPRLDHDPATVPEPGLPRHANPGPDPGRPLPSSP